MKNNSIVSDIQEGKTTLGIEFGSTRIKAVLLDASLNPIAQGSFTWESSLENGHWTYSMDAVRNGLQTAYANLANTLEASYGIVPSAIGCIGISAMMHGYLALDDDGNLLVPFRTWRDTTTAQAAEELTRLFSFNIPQRWSIAHYCQAFLDGEPHVRKIARLTTLAGLVHSMLSDTHVLGLDDASGMFPVDPETNQYDARMLAAFDARFPEAPHPIQSLLPKPLPAGAAAGTLTAQGARLLDPTGTLRPGIPLCPPEGDAGTGMVATGSVAPRTGNVSAGTSIFAMLVLEKPLNGIYPEIDIVHTPDGAPVAMVHCNNCSGELDTWVRLFADFASDLLGISLPPDEIYARLYRCSLQSTPDAAAFTPVNYVAGEGVTHFDAGIPLLLRDFSAPASLPDFMRSHLYATFATLRLGLDILEPEKIRIDRLFAHGGLFKTPGVAQAYLAAATRSPVSVMQTAGEGGPYGMAILAAYRLHCMDTAQPLPLFEFLRQTVFSSANVSTLEPDPAICTGFDRFLQRFKAALSVERSAVQTSLFS